MSTVSFSNRFQLNKEISTRRRRDSCNSLQCTRSLCDWSSWAAYNELPYALKWKIFKLFAVYYIIKVAIYLNSILIRERLFVNRWSRTDRYRNSDRCRVGAHSGPQCVRLTSAWDVSGSDRALRSSSANRSRGFLKALRASSLRRLKASHRALRPSRANQPKHSAAAGTRTWKRPAADGCRNVRRTHPASGRTTFPSIPVCICTPPARWSPARWHQWVDTITE